MQDSHIFPPKKQNSYLHHLHSRNFNESIPKMTKKIGARDVFSIIISLIGWCFWWWTYQHHNELELEQVSSQPFFSASWGFPPGLVFFFVGNPCKKWGKFRLRNQSKLMERTSFCLNPPTGLKFEPPKTTKNRPYSWNLALLEGLGKHLAERSCQRLMNQIWGQMV